MASKMPSTLVYVQMLERFNAHTPASPPHLTHESALPASPHPMSHYTGVWSRPVGEGTPVAAFMWRGRFCQSMFLMEGDIRQAVDGSARLSF